MKKNKNRLSTNYFYFFLLLFLMEIIDYMWENDKILCNYSTLSINIFMQNVHQIVYFSGKIISKLRESISTHFQKNKDILVDQYAKYVSYS